MKTIIDTKKFLALLPKDEKDKWFKRYKKTVNETIRAAVVENIGGSLNNLLQ